MFQSTPVTNASIAFEEALKEDLLDLAESSKDFDISVFVHRGFDDVVNENILGNYNLLFSGFAIMFVYVLVMLGKFNCVEQRVWLSVAGMNIGIFVLLFPDFIFKAFLGSSLAVSSALVSAPPVVSCSPSSTTFSPSSCSASASTTCSSWSSPTRTLPRRS